MKVIIDRFDGKQSYQKEYIVGDEGLKSTLLALLFHIKETQDITLNFTASCRSAICGACAVRVNGHSYLACDTKMDELLVEFKYYIYLSCDY